MAGIIAQKKNQTIECNLVENKTKPEASGSIP